MERKNYVWNYDRLMAFLVALINCSITVYISVIVMMDEYFLRNQIGLREEPSFALKMIVISIICVVTIMINVKFIMKNHRARMVIAFIQTVMLAFILRNLFVGVLYSGFVIKSYALNILGLILLSFLIYNTLFSEKIISYFNLEKK